MADLGKIIIDFSTPIIIVVAVFIIQIIAYRNIKKKHSQLKNVFPERPGAPLLPSPPVRIRQSVPHCDRMGSAYRTRPEKPCMPPAPDNPAASSSADRV